MSDSLIRTLGGETADVQAPDVPTDPAAGKPTQATPEDESAAADPLGRTNDGPAARNREVPPAADHRGRDRDGAI